MSVINSIINAAIAATVPTASVSNAIFPYSNLLPAGTYESEILSVADAIQNDNVIGIDCIHKLTNPEGKSFLVKFRLFAPRDIDELIQKLQSYGLAGSIGDALTGLKEDLDIAQRSNSRYVYIASRSLKNSHAGQQSPSRKGGILGSRRRPPTFGSTQSQTAHNNLLADDEDYEDFLDQEED